jgi:hypothetical protein
MEIPPDAADILNLANFLLFEGINEASEFLRLIIWNGRECIQVNHIKLI